MDDLYQIKVGPTSLPIDLEETKLFLRVDVGDDDTVIKALMSAAVEQGEKFTNRAFIERTITGFFSNAQITQCERYPFITIRRAPLISITSFKAEVDGSLVDVDADSYQEKNTPSFARILITEPLTADDVPYPWQIEFKAGYGTEKTIPDDIKDALKMHVAFFYENRGDVAPYGKISMPLEVKSVYGKYRILDTF